MNSHPLMEDLRLLGLSVRSEYYLERRGVMYVAEIAAFSQADLLETSAGFGLKSLREVRETLKNLSDSIGYPIEIGFMSNHIQVQESAIYRPSSRRYQKPDFIVDGVSRRAHPSRYRHVLESVVEVYCQKQEPNSVLLRVHADMGGPDLTPAFLKSAAQDPEIQQAVNEAFSQAVHRKLASSAQPPAAVVAAPTGKRIL